MKKMNPAVKSMIQLLGAVLVLIGAWVLIGLIAFPKAFYTLDRTVPYITSYAIPDRSTDALVHLAVEEVIFLSMP